MTTLPPTAFRGVGVGRGMAVGPVAKAYPSPVVPPGGGGDPALLEAAFATVAGRLRDRAAAASGALARVLTATVSLAEDPALLAESRRRVDAGESPAEAVDRAVGGFAEMFAAAGGQLAERVTDLRSVRDRVVAELLGLHEPGVPPLERPSVVVAEDLAPADTATLDVASVLAVVTERGGPTGHTAIIAGQLGLPCIVQAEGVMSVETGREVAVDAAAGTVVVDPTDEVREDARARARAVAALEHDVSPGATADGHAVALLANIGSAADAARAAAGATQGVGLFRTEVLFLDRSTAPTLEEQADVYTDVLRHFAGRETGGKVVVRTLDAGADKPLPFATEPEENPALGVRGYRLVRREPGLLSTQLRALAEAARRTGTTPWVMAPMIATAQEAADFAAAAREAGLTGRCRTGVMVEVPSAALRAGDLLRHVDFVSLGTNDLAQYTMATDRLRGALADLIDPWQPAVLDLVAATARAGEAADKPVSVCGESAADPLMALVLVGLGVTSLSMSAGSVPAVRHMLARHTLATCRRAAESALAATSAPDARAAVRALVDPEVVAVLAL